MNELIELLGDFIPPGKKYICLDEEMKHKLGEMEDIMIYRITSADEINAERGMSAISMGFDPYGIDRISIGYERRVLELISWVLGGSPTLLMPVKKEVDEDDPFRDEWTVIVQDEDLPF